MLGILCIAVIFSVIYTKIVVQIDSRYPAKNVVFDSNSVQLPISINNKSLTCSYQPYGYPIYDVTPNSLPKWSLKNLYLKYIMDAKLHPVSDTCLSHSKYEICFQEHIKFRNNTDTTDFYYQVEHTRFYNDGSISQVYVSKNKSEAIVKLNCTISQLNVVSTEYADTKHIINVAGPYFCDWRKDSFIQMYLSSLLYTLENVCFHYAESEVFVYCYPRVANKFTFTGSDLKSKATVIGNFGEPRDLEKNNWLYTQLHEKFHKWKFSDFNFRITSKVPPAILIHIYEHSKYNIIGEPIKLLSLDMKPGDICSTVMDKPIHYTTTVYFFCPYNFKKSTGLYKFVKAEQPPPLCSHPEFLPHLSQEYDVNAVVCYGTNKALAEDITKPEKPSFIDADYLNDQLYLQAEHIPTFVNDLSFNIDHLPLNPKSYFADNSYIKVSPEKLPKFTVGDTVYHKGLKIEGIIKGWDLNIRAPPQWIENLKKYYPDNIIHENIFYRIQVIKENKLTNSQIYSPELMLSAANSKNKVGQLSVKYTSGFLDDTDQSFKPSIT